jgi:hypothetical protein
MKQRGRAARWLRAFVTVLLAYCLAACCVCGAFAFLWEYQEGISREAREQFLSAPLPALVTNELCQGNLIPNSVADCRRPQIEIQKRYIYAIVKANVQPGTTTYEHVTRMFGKYVDYCDDRTKVQVFSCDYYIGGTSPGVRIFYNSSTDIVEEIRQLS